MLWIAPSKKDDATQSLERKLWNSADQFRANSGLKAREYFFCEFAHSAGQKGGEFYTPSCIAGLLTEVIGYSTGASSTCARSRASPPRTRRSG